ncbi:DNA-binding transcriptional regulator, AcrR family [Chitinophaga eiseniae]|uniref:DNA-binding transcriptional regulator, AcrR family n=2 Tax=Chitinophaga eiseniae TaxID=634771 RepID=A0A1T4TZA8_9BACT|nr:TetR/AcrR family transcriptional regulator [uncultured Chitinophaga sp.]SKA45797.1 DNA-binding transcriptional regulator, AcrR family [Chitinophaga eiseniae]
MRTRNTEKMELVRQMTMQMVATNGIENFSVNSLAKACGISVATLYIYYKDKDDLIIQVAMEEGVRLTDAILKDFDPDQSFETGLWQQWTSRAIYLKANPLSSAFIERIQMSSYGEKAGFVISSMFHNSMQRFVEGAIKRKELIPLPVEAWWSVAFAPLYNLLRFHYKGRGVTTKTFILTDELLRQTFEVVVKALKP